MPASSRIDRRQVKKIAYTRGVQKLLSEGLVLTTY
jgi:hypothetical protein